MFERAWFLHVSHAILTLTYACVLRLSAVSYYHIVLANNEPLEKISERASSRSRNWLWAVRIAHLGKSESARSGLRRRGATPLSLAFNLSRVFVFPTAM